MVLKITGKRSDLLYLMDVIEHYPSLMRLGFDVEDSSVFVCSGCGKPIREGQRYSNLCGEQWCVECVNKSLQEAKYDPH